jgi:F-type H+-transporting ATPase subunit delta
MSLATSYAKALYESAKAQGTTSAQFDEIEQQFDGFVALLKDNDQLHKALMGPVVTAKEKVGVIEAISQKSNYSKPLTLFLVLLAQKERLQAVLDIHEAFTSVRLEAEGAVSGRLVSADPLNDSDLKALSDAFTNKLGKRVAFRVSTDASLLAGMKVTVGGVTYDGTLKSQLQKLRDEVVAGYAKV